MSILKFVLEAIGLLLILHGIVLSVKWVIWSLSPPENPINLIIVGLFFILIPVLFFTEE